MQRLSSPCLFGQLVLGSSLKIKSETTFFVVENLHFKVDPSSCFASLSQIQFYAKNCMTCEEELSRKIILFTKCININGCSMYNFTDMGLIKLDEQTETCSLRMEVPMRTNHIPGLKSVGLIASQVAEASFPLAESHIFGIKLPKGTLHLSLELSILRTWDSMVTIQNLSSNNIFSGNHIVFIRTVPMCFTFCRD